MYIIDSDYFVRGVLESSEDELINVIETISGSYVKFSIPKKDGTREISAIEKNSTLAHLQERLLKNFLERIPLPVPVVGFVPGKSYVDFLKPHIGKRYYLRVDIRDFFGSIEANLIRMQLREYFSNNCDNCIEYIISLCLLDNKLPQGAITSPAISNISFSRIDQRILKYCQSFTSVYVGSQKSVENIVYTRYADDLLFSSDVLDFSKELFFLGMIRKLLKEAGFRANEKKIHFGNKEITLSGYVLSENIHLSRKKLYSINKLIHFFGKTDNYSSKKYRVRKTLFNSDWITEINQLHLRDGHGNQKYFNSVPDVLNYLCGYRAFLLSVIRCNSENNESVNQLKRKVQKLEQIIDEITIHVA